MLLSHRLTRVEHLSVIDANERETPWSRDVDDLLLFICAAGTVRPPVEPRFLDVFIVERKALLEVPSNLELLGF